MRKAMLTVAVALSIASIAVSANDTVTHENLSEVEEKLKTSFGDLKATHFGVTDIEGLFEIVVSGRLMYYMPEKERLFVGEIYDRAGLSLTAERKRQLQKARVKTLDLSDALTVGNGDVEIIEFTDPDCPYCRKLHQHLVTQNNAKRKIIFSISERTHPKAVAKAVHVYCSKDKEMALDAVLTGKANNNRLIDCDYGRDMVARHKRISENFGVSGTPTVVLGDSVVTGYREAQIAQYLQSQ